MLTRQQVNDEMKRTGMLETAEKLFALTVLSVPALKNDKGEYFNVAEYEIRRAFETAGYNSAPDGPLKKFSQQLSFTDEDLAFATEKTKLDLQLLGNVPDVEIAVTAIFIWFAQAGHDNNGDFIPEFMYFSYKLAEPCRKDQALKKRGFNHLVEQFRQSPLEFLKVLSSFQR